MKKKKKVVYGILIYICCLLGASIIPFSVSTNKVLAVLTITMSIAWVYECSNNTYLMIMSVFIAYSNYSIVMGIYLDEGLRPKYLYPQITDVNVYGIGILVLFLAMQMLVFLTPKYSKCNFNVAEYFVKPRNENNLFFYLVTALFFLIIIVGYSGAKNSRGSSSPLYEYGAILLIIMFYFSGLKKGKLAICTGACLVYSLTSLLNGTRIEALICILIYVLCFFRKGIKPATMLVGMVAGIVVFSTVGALRGNWMPLLRGDFSVLSVIFKNKFVFDTCTHAYFPMLCMIEEFKDISLVMRIHYLIAFLLTIFAGQSRIADGNLIQVVAEKYYHNYGGVTPGFFYVWFSLAGSAVFAYIVHFYTSFVEKSISSPSEIKSAALLYAVASVPRWYLYGPWSFTRGVLICAVVFVLIKKISGINKYVRR